jgi:glycosyltransferase involved in cell wall biosynthesis
MLEASLQEPAVAPVWIELPGPVSTAPANRILIVMHDFSGGGTERVAIRLANQWAQLGRTVHIFCGSEAGPARGLVGPSVTVEQADPPLPRGLFSRIRLGWALAEAAARFAPDAVFGPGNFHLLVLAAFARRDRSSAAIFCKISNPLIRAGQRGVRAWLRRRVLKALTDRVDSLIAMSPALRAEAEALVSPERVTSQWEPIFETTPDLVEGRAREPGLIVAVGRLEPQKNFALAIRAMEHLVRWTDARLVILGEGAERARLTEMIARLGLEERVSLAGHVGDIKPWLQRASCFLMTSHYEGYPAALVEALACGAPTLVTPCSPALAEILPHASIGMIVSSDAETIACALQALLRRPRRQKTGPLLLARHDEARVAASYLELMDRPWRPAVRYASWSMHAR